MLNFYKAPTSEAIVNDSNRIISTHDLALGSWNTIKLYVRNSDNTVYYEDIEVYLDLEENPTKDGIAYSLYRGEIEPTAMEWGDLPLNTEISIANAIGTISSSNIENYYGFFMRVYVPSDASIGWEDGANLVIVAIQNPVE